MIVRLPIGLLNANCYLVYDEGSGTTRNAAVIDPGGEIAPLLNEISHRDMNPLYILNTHGHFDHIAGIAQLKTIFPIPTGMHPADCVLMAAGGGARAFGISIISPPLPELLLDDGLILQVGSLQLRVIHTPGHTPGSICLYCPQEKSLFTGDTLFAGSVGRTDLPGGSMSQLWTSLMRLLTLPLETQILPGHGTESTLENELQYNPWLIGLNR